MKHFSVRQISVIAGLAAFSAAVQLVHIGYQSPQFGMWIDIVAVTWIIAYFLFGLRSSLIVSVLGAVMITLFAPDTWLGASMKWVATVPTLLALAAVLAMFRKKLSYYVKPAALVMPFLISVVVRCALVLPLNYFYAIPIWTGLSPSKAIQVIPWFVIVLFNVVQSAVELSLAWILVYRFRLSKYAKTK